MPFPTPEQAGDLTWKVDRVTPLTDDEITHQEMVQAIAASLGEDGLDVENHGIGILSSLTVATLSDKFVITVDMREGLVNIAATDLPPYMPQSERDKRIKKLLLADPGVFASISKHIKRTI